ncbi:MAG: cell wall-binding repeat-containing protein [Actinobacteria bacterium]|nr:cell wall-binding repeat-containing protein [Actinomycetota bacterium]
MERCGAVRLFVNGGATGGRGTRRVVPVMMATFALLLVALFFLAAGPALAADPEIYKTVGRDRYETAILVSQDAYPGGADTVFLVKGDNFPDALAAAPLAAAYDGPVILTPSTGLTQAVSNELQRLSPTRVFVIGLPREVELQVWATLAGRIIIVSVVGTDRYHTAALLADELKKKNGSVPQIVLASGDKFPDALSVAPLAAAKGWAILLTPQAGPLPPVTSQKIQSLGVTKALVVGTYIKPASPVKVVSIVGTDRYHTCALISDYAVDQGLSFGLIGVVTGENYPDALVVGPLVARSGGVILLTRADGLPQVIVDRLDANMASVKVIEAVGVPEAVIDHLIYLCHHYGTYYYGFNVTVPPLDNEKVRRALALSIDREQIVGLTDKSWRALPATSFVPPAITGFDLVRQDYLKSTAQVALAQSLLVDAGFPNGVGLPEIEIFFNTDPIHRTIAQKVAEQWKTIGVKTRLRSLPWDQYLQALATDSKIMVYRMGWTADYDDPYDFFQLFETGSEYNYSRWSDPVFDQALSDSRGPVSDAKLWQLYADMERMLTGEAMPLVPLYWF